MPALICEEHTKYGNGAGGWADGEGYGMGRGGLCLADSEVSFGVGETLYMSDTQVDQSGSGHLSRQYEGYALCVL